MNIIDLLKDFEEDTIIKEGIISVFSDTVGKPGDRILTLNKIELIENNELLFYFGKGEIVKVLNPVNINYFKNKIVILDASNITWKSDNFEFEYSNHNSELNTNLIRGEHVFRIKKGTPAFEFSTW